MQLSEDEKNLLVKIYIGQKVRDEGIVEESLNINEKEILPLLLDKKLIEPSEWKPFRHYQLYKVTNNGIKIGSIAIQEILNTSDIAEQIQKIPLFLLLNHVIYQ